MTNTTPPLTIIHTLLPDDAPILREMLYHAIHVPAGQPPPAREVLAYPTVARYVEGWGRAGDTAMVAVDAERETIVGAAWFRVFPADAPGYGFVDAATPELCVALLPEYRGQGIGSRLLTRLLDKAQRDFAAISLSVDPDNRALRLYQRLGFTPVGYCEGSVVMVKSFARDRSQA